MNDIKEDYFNEYYNKNIYYRTKYIITNISVTVANNNIYSDCGCNTSLHSLPTTCMNINIDYYNSSIIKMLGYDYCKVNKTTCCNKIKITTKDNKIEEICEKEEPYTICKHTIDIHVEIVFILTYPLTFPLSDNLHKFNECINFNNYSNTNINTQILKICGHNNQLKIKNVIKKYTTNSIELN